MVSDVRPAAEMAPSAAGEMPGLQSLLTLAARLCETRVARLGLLEADRQRFIAWTDALPPADLPRALSPCVLTADGEAVLELPDLRQDARFAAHPGLLSEPPLCFYAGVVLPRRDGRRSLTLSVMDSRPRRLDALQRDALQRLAGLLAVQFDQDAELRRERRLRAQAEQRFCVLADVAPVGVYHTDALGNCLFTNQAWQRIYGLDASHSLGDAWAGIVHADDAGAVRLAWSRAAHAVQPFESRYRIRRPATAGGGERSVHSQARPLLAEDGQLLGFVGLVEDLTELEAATRALRDSQELLDRTGRVAGIGGWSLDLRTHELIWSDQACRIHDREPGHRPSMDEALGHYQGEAREALELAVRRGMTEGQPWSLELPMTTAAGRVIWVLAQGQADWADGRPVRLVGAIQDVTAYHRAAIELEQSRERLRGLYEATPAVMHSVDRDGRLLNVSDRWLQRLGYRRHEVIGRPLDAFMTAESGRRAREVLRPLLWRDGVLNDSPVQMVCADGTVRDMLVSAVVDPGSDPDGRPPRALALMDDITDDLRQRAELAHEQQLRRQLERHTEELDQLLRERSEMLDVLAHEVRQPLNNASAALQSAAANLAGRGERQAHDRLTRAQAVLGQVLAGVDNTLAAASLLAGGGQVALQDTDVDTLIAVTIADLARDQRDRVVVKRHTATRTVQTDMSLMRLALRNLLTNALRYSPGVSPVTLHVMDVDEPLALRFEVADAGPGIPDALLPRLFTRGARGGGAESTHGLGLYIVRRVMELHGGNVELVRTGPLGTVMRLTLPLAG